jgi:Holliday junction resolvasome RuvABC endonuclease subunit
MAPPEIVIGIDVSFRRFAIAAYAHPGLVTVARNVPLTAGRQYSLIRQAVKDMRDEVGEPGFVGIEQPHFGFPKAAYMHGMAVARTEDAVRSVWRHAPQRFFQPTEWRRIAGVGGRASKERVAEFVRGFGFKPATEDESDAACIAIAMWVEAFGD